MKNKGFTLIELLVVIAIIGLLASIVLVAVGSARGRGVDGTVKSQLQSIRSSAEYYATTHGNGYALMCADITTSLNNAIKAYGGLVADVNIVNGTAGSGTKVTCHAQQSGYVVEAPLFGSTSGTPKMWCVDSLGTAEENATNVGTGVYTCP